MDDLKYIAQELLAKYSGEQKVTKPVVPVAAASEKQDDEKKERISMKDYLQKRKELDAIINASHPKDTPDDADDESSSCTSSDDSVSESESEALSEEGEMVAEIESENEEDVPRSKNELVELPPVEPLPFSEVPEVVRLIRVGCVFGVVDELVLVQSDETYGDNQALDIGSILVFKDRKVLGQIFETFGQVTRPLYSIRFNSVEEIDKERAKLGEPIFRADSEEYSKVVLPAKLKAFKGTDASNIYDEEIPEEEQDYSDDEKEREAKSKKKGNKARREPRFKPDVPTPPVTPQTNNSNQMGSNIQQQHYGSFPQGYYPQQMYYPQMAYPGYNPGYFAAGQGMQMPQYMPAYPNVYGQQFQPQGYFPPQQNIQQPVQHSQTANIALADQMAQVKSLLDKLKSNDDKQ
ncbi:hypothetical protein MP638_005317 [Amoeboaphelidium occidentale]|nr:hypothetical protein MP638_005317 [Amoeboaphelidium occidentale]